MLLRKNTNCIFRSVDVSLITIANLSTTGTAIGANSTIVATNASGGYASTFEITLGSDVNLTAGYQ